MAHGKHDAHADSQQHHIIPFGIYIKVFAALVCLTILTVFAAQINFGPWNTVIAMLIASIKAGLVLSFFMHLKYDNKMYVVCFSTALFFLLVLYFFTNLDILTRMHVGNIL
jgi:cytochrome c oxidase subunit IV